MIAAIWPRLGRRLGAWLDRQTAAWTRESARTWPAAGDVWTGFGEMIEVRRAAVRVDGRNGVDLLITKGTGRARAVWAPYAEFTRCTQGMTLVRRGGA